MDNPYVILGIAETADDHEIKEALKKQINLFCGGDNDSRKNSDGEYLKEIFVQAARDLLSPEKRKKIDAKLAKDREKYALEISSKNKNEDGSNKTKKKDKKDKKEKKRNVKKLDICVYNKNCIGLFKRIEWVSSSVELFPSSGIIYIGVDSNYVGMKTLLDMGISENKFSSVGEVCTVDYKKYVANCKIKKAISFDDMRFKLYRSGIIGPYTMGEATTREILDVMCYAADYYDLEKKDLKKKDLKMKHLKKKKH